MRCGASSPGALIGKTPLNADGFGLAWYGLPETACIYKDVNPAWSDADLNQIVRHTQSRLFMVHVRASTSTATSRNNCQQRALLQVPRASFYDAPQGDTEQSLAFAMDLGPMAGTWLTAADQRAVPRHAILRRLPDDLGHAQRVPCG